MTTSTTDKVAQTFWPVNSPSPDSMIHHKVSTYKNTIKGYPIRNKIVLRKGMYLNHYGVSLDYRVLTKGVLDKRYKQITHCLRDVIALPTCEREATLRLLRFWAYYGNVYPKASQVCAEPGCSKATFWRAMMHLKNIGLIKTTPRYRMHPHAQISNLYLLHNLIVVIARYLAEHGRQFKEKWLKSYLSMPGSQFWSQLATGQLKLPLQGSDAHAGA